MCWIPSLGAAPRRSRLALSPPAVANRGSQPMGRGLGEAVLPTKPLNRDTWARLSWHGSCVMLSRHAKGRKSIFFPSGICGAMCTTTYLLWWRKPAPCSSLNVQIPMISSALHSRPVPYHHPANTHPQPCTPSQKTGLKQAEKSMHGDMHK